LNDNEEKLKALMGQDYGPFYAFRKSLWVGSFSVDELLDNCLNQNFPKPPVENSVYIVSSHSWKDKPTQECQPLYIGSITGKTARFKARIGDLIADTFGFFDTNGGHSSGGMSLYHHCKEYQINPKNLHIGWLKNCGCSRCAEWFFWDYFEPTLNRISPPYCKEHKGEDVYLAVPPNQRIIGRQLGN
jgi:hypothetical protein